MKTLKRNPGLSGSGGDTGRMEERRRMTPIASGVLTCLLLTACAGARYHNDGMGQIGEGNIDTGIASLKKATELDRSQSYKIDYLVQRDKHADAFVKQGDLVRASGDIAGARDLYGRALALSPSNARAAASLKALDQDVRNDQLLAEGDRYLKEGKLEAASERAARVLADQPGNKQAAQLRKAVLDARAAADLERDRFREAKSVMGSPVTLQFRDATMRTVFEALSKSTGLNILMDREVKSDARVTIFVKDVAVEDAIDLILMQNQLEKRIVNSNTLMVYAATAAKQSEYQELTVRSFRVTNSDLKYLAGMLKTMLKLKDVSADERSGLLVIRDTPETLRVAEKLIALHDEPDPEVMLEVEVLEISEGRNSNLGVQPPNAITISTPPGGGATTPGGTVSNLTIAQLRQLGVGGLTVTPIAGTLNFKLQDTETRILASPRIRARNREKAKIMIGDRVPTIINNVTPVNGGSSVVTGTITYQDVGLKLEFEPQVYASNDVGIKINLEVSNIAREFTDAQGSRSYQIGTRNASTFLRLADGETQVLGGLITDEERNTADKIPGLGHLPVVGRLFGNSGTTKSRSEIVLAITPRIVRNYANLGHDRANVFSGTALTLRDRQILGDPVGGLSLPNSAPGARPVPVAAPASGITPAPQALPGTPGAPSPAPSVPQPPPQPVPTMPLSGGGLPAPPPMIKR
jgi:general secretion pathway protein D